MSTSNQLLKVEDAVANIALAESADFKNYSNTATEYTYNANGAMTKDMNKGISDIQYNLLNLPRQMDIKSPVAEARNEYTYSAGGQKLKMEQKWNPNYSTAPVIGSAITASLLTMNKTTDYIGNMIYENGALKRILIDGGYIEGGVYYYYLNDHQGNTRLVCNASGTVIQKNHYYPFGMTYAETPVVEQGKQPYKFEGKELDCSYGLDFYDFEARAFDPVLMRFTRTDPMAEKYPWISPMEFCNNNPVRFVDPTGMDWYQADNGNVMWRRSHDKEYKDDDGNVWKNIGTEYMFEDGKTHILFKQRENEDGDLSLYSTDDEKEISKYYGNKFKEEHPINDGPLENVYPEFDLILLGRGLFNMLSNGVKDALQLTSHGAERIAGEAATRGGVLSISEISTTKALGKVISQANGAIVYLHEVSP